MHHSKFTRTMSLMGHSRRFWHVRAESAFPRIATGQRTCWEVRGVPGPDIHGRIGLGCPPRFHCVDHTADGDDSDKS